MFAVFLLLEILIHVIIAGQAYIMMSSPKSLDTTSSNSNSMRLNNLCGNKYSSFQTTANFVNRRSSSSLLCKLFNSFSFPFTWKRKNLNTHHNFDPIYAQQTTSLDDIIKFNEESLHLPAINALNDHHHHNDALIVAPPPLLYSPPPHHSVPMPPKANSKLNSKFVHNSNDHHHSSVVVDKGTQAATASGREVNNFSRPPDLNNAESSHSHLRSSLNKYHNYGRNINGDNNYWNGKHHHQQHRVSKYNLRPTKPSTNSRLPYGRKLANWKPIAKNVSSSHNAAQTTTQKPIVSKLRTYSSSSKIIGPNNSILKTISSKSSTSSFESSKKSPSFNPKLMYVSTQNLKNSKSNEDSTNQHNNNVFSLSSSDVVIKNSGNNHGIKLNAQLTFSADDDDHNKENNLLGSESETNPYSIITQVADQSKNLNSLQEAVVDDDEEEEEAEIIIGKQQQHTDISHSALTYTVEKSENNNIAPRIKSGEEIITTTTATAHHQSTHSTHKPNFIDITTSEKKKKSEQRSSSSLTTNYYELPINKSSIPGEPWTDYPMFSSSAFSNFSCNKPGFYSDKDYRCQVYHHCGVDNYHQKFICPNGTLFNDHTKSCDYWFNVNCEQIRTSIKITVDNDIDGNGDGGGDGGDENNYSNHNMKGFESIEIVNNKFGSTLTLPRLGIVLESSIKVDDKYNKSQFISDLKKFVSKIEKHNNNNTTASITL